MSENDPTKPENPEEASPETSSAPEPEASQPEAPAGETPQPEAPAAEAPEPTAAAELEAPEPAAPEPAEAALPDLTLGGGAPGEPEPPPEPQMIRGKVDRFGVAMGTGRRKTSVARVRVKEGSGKFIINGRELGEYFQIERDQRMIEAPLKAVDELGKVDVWVRVNGGGTTGQAGAVVLGIARALQVRNPQIHHVLSEGGYLTRDGRMVERKKYGFKKARKSFQFSKR